MPSEESETSSFTTARWHDIDELARLVDKPSKNRQIRVLDLCCGPGGVGQALYDLFTSPRADGWFLGVDIEDYSSTYPGEFVQADISNLTLEDLGLETPVDLVFISPPCQAYSRLSHIHHDDPKEVHPTFDDLNVREVIDRLGNEHIVENVPGCSDLRSPIKLNGPAFGKNFLNERWFETSFDVNSWTEDAIGNELRFCDVGKTEQAKAKSVPRSWTKAEIRSALPREYIGYLLAHCPTLSDIMPSHLPRDYLEAGAGGGQMWLSEF